MIRLLLTICFTFSTVLAFTQTNRVEEDTFRPEGDIVSNIVSCEGSPLFQIGMSNALQQYVLTDIEINAINESIESFETIGQPSFFTQDANSSDYRLRGTSVTSYNEGSNESLKIRVIYKIDSISPPNCDEFIIQLPIKRNMRPKANIREVPLKFRVSGTADVIKYNLLASDNANNSLALFEDEYPSQLKFEWVPGDDHFDNSIENGIIVFRNNISMSEPKEFSAKVRAVDEHNQKSEPVRLNCTIVPDLGSSEITWAYATDGKIVYEEPIYEDQEFIIDQFMATNVVDGSLCDISKKEVMPDVSIVNNKVLKYKPSFNTVEETMGNNTIEVKLPFTAKNQAGRSEDCVVILKVRNATSTEASEKLDIAINNFKKSEKSFYNFVFDPLCYLRYSAMKIVKRENNMAAIESSYNQIGTVFDIASVSNPIVLGVNKTIGIIIHSVSEVDGKKARHIEGKAKSLKSLIEAYKTYAVKFAEEHSKLKNFVTKSEAQVLLDLSLQLENSMSQIKLNTTDYSAVIALFSRSKEEAAIEFCTLAKSSQQSTTQSERTVSNK